MKTRREAAEFFHADRRTNMMKLIVAFCNFQNDPQNLFKHFAFNLVKRFSYIKYTTN